MKTIRQRAFFRQRVFKEIAKGKTVAGVAKTIQNKPNKYLPVEKKI